MLSVSLTILDLTCLYETYMLYIWLYFATSYREFPPPLRERWKINFQGGTPRPGFILHEQTQSLLTGLCICSKFTVC